MIPISLVGPRARPHDPERQLHRAGGGRRAGHVAARVTAQADAIAAIARATGRHLGNFRFAAAPHTGRHAVLSRRVSQRLGCNGHRARIASVVSAGLAEASTLGEAQQHLTELLESRSAAGAPGAGQSPGAKSGATPASTSLPPPARTQHRATIEAPHRGPVRRALDPRRCAATRTSSRACA